MSKFERILPHIATIHDLEKSMDIPASAESPIVRRLSGWTIRMAARCIVVDPTTHRIALQALDTEDVVKIPGGGLQYDADNESEDFEKGVVREIAEEIGVNAANMNLEPIGMVIEYRSEWKLTQLSHCYVGNISEGEQYTEPREEGSHLVWADTPAHAIELVQQNGDDTYDKRFMKERDIAILEYYNSISTAI